MEKRFFVATCCFFFSHFVSGISRNDIFRGVPVKNCGVSNLPPSSDDRIVGGKNVKHGQHPWMVSLQENDGSGFEHVCGASVLNEHWIVTAAHCIDLVNQPYRYQVLLGLHKLSRSNDPTVQIIKISKIVLHKDYNDETFHNDIALLRTAKAIDIAGSNGYVNGICLPRSSEDPTGLATVAGWGHTYEDGQNSDTLKEVAVPIIPRDLCNEAYDEDPYDGADEVTENMVCAGMAQKDSCQNDSGGPLIQTSNGVATLVGVVSHGSGCGMRYYPGIYTKVASYTDWIQSIVSE